MHQGDGSVFALIIHLAIIAFYVWVGWKILEKAGKRSRNKGPLSATPHST